MSLQISDVIETLKKLGATPALLIKTETELEALVAEQKDEAQAAPKSKSELVTILLDPEGKLAGLGDFVSIVVQIPQGDDAGQVLPKLFKSVYDQKAGAKKKVKVIETVCDAAEGVKRKWFKENGLQIKTKSPVRTLISDNKIPQA